MQINLIILIVVLKFKSWTFFWSNSKFEILELSNLLCLAGSCDPCSRDRAYKYLDDTNFVIPVHSMNNTYKLIYVLVTEFD